MNRIYGTASFVCSAGRYAELPPPEGDEFALAGRSNAGKSSFINHACGNHALARTSKKPGKTICANLYHISGTLYWVDLPGYGYTGTAERERRRWSRLIEEYCGRRENLAGIIWFVDIRHIGVAIDLEAYGWLRKLKKPVLPVLAKADKLSRQEREKQRALFMKIFAGFGEPVVYSILEHPSRERFWERFERWRGGGT